MIYRLTFAVALVLLVLRSGAMSLAQVPALPTSAPGTLIESDGYIRSDQLGITFISSIDNINHPARYRNALILGAGWNRWPLYWDRVETQPDSWDWSAYDELMIGDSNHGLAINAILLGRPDFWGDGDSITNLYEPIFADGRDSASADTPINENNPWARFVHRAASRYKPGGSLAQERAGIGDAGIRVWEIWNEPDHVLFWRAGSDAYARMLKTAAIVIKTLDPQATVLFGGLLFSSDQSFFSQVLRAFRADSLRDQYHWFFDAVAVHSYDDPWRSGWLTKYVIDIMAEYDLERPVWVNETGVSVWNDYPGPVWTSEPLQRQRLATTRQQAHFLIMSAAFAWSKGADKVFFHQLYDDCGNQAAGTDFPPHAGELCDGRVCHGDAFGIYRNPKDAVCYSQHPLANTPRPVAFAYRTLARVFGSQPFSPVSLNGLYDAVTTIIFKRDSGEKITVVWNNTFEARTHLLTANAATATVHFISGERDSLRAMDGVYRLDLKPASDFAYPDLESNRISAIGGEPIILIEWPT